MTESPLGRRPNAVQRIAHVARGIPARDRLTIAGLLAVALLARLVAVLVTADYVPAVDDASYDIYARSIAAGDGYPESIFAPAGGPSAFWPPGYPYFLAGIYALFGHGWDIARMVQVGVGVGTVALVGVLAWQLAGRRVALIAMAIAAVYPPLVLPSATLYTEVLFIPLALAAVVLTLQHRLAPGRLAVPVAAGVMAGLAIHVRPIGIFMLLAILVAARGEGTLRQRLRAPVALGLAAALTLLPWVIRNAIVVDEPVYSTNLSYVLAGTYNDTSAEDDDYPAAWRPPNLVPEFDDLLAPTSGLDELELSARFREEAREYVAAHPLYPLRVAWFNTRRTFDLGGYQRARIVYHEQGFGTRTADIAIVSSYVLVLLALLGATTRAARSTPRFVWAVPALLLAGAIVGSGVSRYRLPLDPFFVVLAAFALIAAAERIRGPRPGEATG